MLKFEAFRNRIFYFFVGQSSFDAEYGVEGMVKAKSEKFQSRFIRAITGGTVSILIGVCVFLSGAAIDEKNEPLLMGLTSVMFLFIAAGVFLIVRAGITKDGYSKLLQEGDYSKEEKSNTVLNAVTPAYWMVITAIYLTISFLTNRWDITWLVWAVAGVLYGGLSVVLRAVHKSRQG